MNCEECLRVLDAYVDGELDGGATTAVRAHLASCTACAARQQSLGALGDALRGGATYHEPPAGLESRLAQSLRRSLAPEPKPRASRQLWRLGAPALLVAAALALFVMFRQPAADERLTDEVIAAHIRSLQVDHITDVASSDQHTVKPWFQGKLTFAVSAKDHGERGFPLVGGRLDYLDGEPAAALVYQSGKHLVNVFVWPTRQARAAAPQRVERRGYHAYSWVRDGLRHFVVSDLNDVKLQELVQLLQTPG